MPWFARCLVTAHDAFIHLDTNRSQFETIQMHVIEIVLGHHISNAIPSIIPLEIGVRLMTTTTSTDIATYSQVLCSGCVGVCVHTVERIPSTVIRTACIIIQMDGIHYYENFANLR